MLRGAVDQGDRVLVTFPDGETRRMEPGPSSVISRAVVEEFAPRFLIQPAVIWLSESKSRVVSRDDDLAQEIGLEIQPDRNLPDLILVDLGPEHPLLVFVEVVATSGEIDEVRRAVLLKVATDAGFRPEQVTFVTAYDDRDSRSAKATLGSLAWNSFAWFTTEPDQIVFLHSQEGNERYYLSNMIERER